MDEYRFQVDLNWKRTQYFLAFNVALIAVSTGLASRENNVVAAGLYMVGVVSALLCVVSSQVQHAYYREARDRMRRIGDALNLGDFAIATTPGAGGASRRLGSVTAFNLTILGLLSLVNVVGTWATVIDVS